jgi:hypothetical protein
VAFTEASSVSETYREAIRWWLSYLRIFIVNPPWQIPGKFTIGVGSSTGEEIARLLELTPKEVIDAHPGNVARSFARLDESRSDCVRNGQP